MPKISFYLNDIIPAITPEPLYAHAVRMGYETEHWTGKANSYSQREGSSYGEGYLLMRWGDISSISINSQVSMTIRQAPSSGESGSASQITFGKLHLKSIKAIYSVGVMTDDTPCLVHVVDARHVLQMSSINKSYNTPSPAPASKNPDDAEFYDVESLNAGSVWTWQEMLNDIWDNLPSSYAGSAPTLPYSPDGLPYDFNFRGMSAWDAVWVVLDTLRVGLTLSPSGSVSLFQRSVAQPELSSAYENNKQYGVGRNLAQSSVATRIPENIKITFSKTHVGPGVAVEIARSGNYLQNMLHTETVATGVAGAISGTSITLHDDFQAVIAADGSVLNSSDLTSRATERVQKLVSALQKSLPTRTSYVGYRSDFVPGSEIKQVVHADLAVAAGLTTEITQQSSDADVKLIDLWSQIKQREMEGVGGGGSSIGGMGGRPGIIGRELAMTSKAKPKAADAHTVNQVAYPHHTHLVKIDDGASATGALVARNSDGLYLGKIIQADPDEPFTSFSAYTEGEDCFIVASNLYVGSTNSNAKICQGEIYPAKINGAFNSGGDVRPLFILHRSQNEIWHVTAGGAIGAGASGTVTLPDGRSVTVTNWSTDVPITAGMKITVFLDQTNSQYYAIAAKISNAEIYACTVGSPTIAPNATGYVITQTGGTISPARNWSTTKVIYGDKVVCWKDSSDNQYYFLKGGGGLRWFKAITNGATDGEGGAVSVSLVKALDGGPVPAISVVSNPHKLAALGAKEVTFCEDYSGENLDYRLVQAEHVKQRTIVDLKYDATLNSLMYKYRDCWVLSDEDVSGWQTFAVCVQTDIVSNVYLSSDDIKVTKSTAVVLELGTPVTSNLMSFTSKTFVKEVTYDGTDLTMVQFDAKIWTPTTENPTIIVSTTEATLVYDVEDRTTDLYQHKTTLTVWDIASTSGEVIVEIEECE